jgi:hypothetical protein
MKMIGTSSLDLMSNLKDTIGDVPILEADNTQTVRWYLDTVFAVHKKSHGSGHDYGNWSSNFTVH